MSIPFREFQKDPPRLKVTLLCEDPLLAERSGLGPVEVDLEPERYLEQGPTTARVAVVDYDARLDVVFAPVQVLERRPGFAVGNVGAVRENFLFHQQNVWAVVNRTIALLENPRLLGRPIPWASGLGRLLLLPHANYGRNAFYDRGTGAIHFLYFEGSSAPVFTCLSHDIVTHELGHAVLDGLKPYYNEISSAQTAAFHEYFGDVMAIASSLTFRELVVRVAGDAPPELPELIGRIGEEFASTDGRSSLRDASVRRTMADVKGNREEHDLSQVLTNVFYELLVALYPKKVEAALDNLKKTKVDGQVAVRALINAAAQTTSTMLRGLDYCPPVDVSYLEYARAVLRADEVAYPTYEVGGRAILRRLFVERGVAPSESELDGPPRVRNRDLHPYDVDEISATTANAYRFLDANRGSLRIPRDVNFSVIRLYRTRKGSPSGYYPPQEIIIEFVWTEDVELKSEGLDFGELAGTRMPLYCGGTLVFDAWGNVLHYVLRDATPERTRELLEYVAYLVDRGRIGTTAQGAAIFAEVENGRLRLQRNPALRHESRRHADDVPTQPEPAGEPGPIDWNFTTVDRIGEPKNLSSTDWRRLREKIRGAGA
ncbi:hypothetical protein K2Z84_03340 [Candidatus Binatia bacterium]|nr:hypothetical protein [Candidatus Binatia bacterium]